MADVYIYNNQNLIIKYYKKVTQTGGLIVDGMLPSYENVQIYLNLKNGYKKVVSSLKYPFLLLHNFFNFVNLEFLN